MNDGAAIELFSGLTLPLFPFPYLIVLIVVALPFAAFVGHHLGRIEYRRRRYDEVHSDKIPGGTTLGAMLALLGLLLGFSFSSALGWREGRQSALVDEAMAISTAFMTADLLDDPGRTDLQSQILQYAKTRLVTPEDTDSQENWAHFLNRVLAAQAEVWPTARRAIDQEPSDPIRAAVARSITDMLDAGTGRLAAAAQQIPMPAKGLLLCFAIASTFILGNRSALQGRSLTWRTFTFSAVLALVIVVVIDLDRAFEGMMRINVDTILSTIHDMEVMTET